MKYCAKCGSYSNNDKAWYCYECGGNLLTGSSTKMPKNHSDNHNLDYSLLLITHMICADNKLHIKEKYFLDKLIDEIQINDSTREEIHKILNKEDDAVSIKEAADRVPRKDRKELLLILYIVGAHIDDFYDPEEHSFLNNINDIWKIPSISFEQIKSKSIMLLDEYKKIKAKDEIQSKPKKAKEISSNAKIFKVIEQFFSSNKYDIKSQMTSKSILIKGPEYDEIIKKCRRVSEEDIKVTEVNLKRTKQLLEVILSKLNDEIDNLKILHTKKHSQKSELEESKDFLEEHKYRISNKVSHISKIIDLSLIRKQRAVNYYTISFMGKTKAGKSTLHAIITGDGWEAIGKGKPRTTRINRVYEWENIRIIDTPGVGYPGPEGKKDEEIAKSVIDESDIICFVVTDNNQALTEFNFLKDLKNKAKPFIVLLNVQKDLYNETYLKRFLKDPDRLFSMEDKKLGGHINHIKNYAKKCYGNDYFRIIPVHLQSALLSKKYNDENLKEKLYKASRFQDFLDNIRVSLINDGVIRRSQTLLGSTVHEIESSLNLLNDLSKKYKSKHTILQEFSEKATEDIERKRDEIKIELEYQLKQRFQYFNKSLEDFAEKNWNLKQNELNVKLRQHIKTQNIEAQIMNVFKEKSEKYRLEVCAILKNMRKEIKITDQLEGFDFKSSEQDSDSFWSKDTLGWGGVIAGLLGSIAFFIPGLNIAAISIGIAGGVIKLLSNFFKSNAEKKREAVENILNDLQSQTNKNKEKVINDCKKQFDDYHSSVIKELQDSFDTILKGLKKIEKNISQASVNISSIKNDLNFAYAKRVIDWCENRVEPLSKENINSTIKSVKRDLGKSMIVLVKREISFLKNEKEISDVLQEEVEFIKY